MKQINFNSLISLTIFVILIIWSKSSAQEWVHGGPFGGSITTVVIAEYDSTVLFCATEDSDFYVFDPNSMTWEKRTSPISDLEDDELGFHTEHVKEIETHHSQPGRIFVGLRNHGMRFSEDEGFSWSTIDLGLKEAWHCHTIIIHDENPDIINAAFWLPPNRGDRLYRSIDGGNTWSLQGSNRMFRDIVAIPGNPDHLYGLEGQSFDAGETWTDMN